MTARIIAYLISHPQFNIWNISYIPSHSLLTGSLESIKWPAPNVSGFVAQLVRASHRCCKVTGSNPVDVLNFSRFYIRNYINCVHNCEDHSFLDFTSAVQYMKYFINNFSSPIPVFEILRLVWTISCVNKDLIWRAESCLCRFQFGSYCCRWLQIISMSRLFFDSNCFLDYTRLCHSAWFYQR